MDNSNINSVGDFIRDVFSTLVNRDNEIFKALLASDDEGKPGTMEKILNDIEETRDKWCNSPNIYEQDGEMLEKTLSLFSVLTRAYNEDDVSLKWRNRLLYVRNGDTIWGDRWDIIKLFKAYFNSDFVYIVNNTDEIANNLLSDGDFEENTGAWELDSCEYSHDACFCGRSGILFDGVGKCSQTVNINTNSVYFLHFFGKGNINVEIKDDHGRYWKPANPYVDEFGAWANTPTKINVTGNPDKWEPMSVFFLSDSPILAVTISFIGVNGEETYIDYARLFKKENYSTFTLVVAFSGRSTQDTMGLAPGTDDPIVARNYSGYKHFSGGKNDADKTNYDKLSFFDNAAINENKEPVLAGGKDDPGEITHLPNDGYIEDTPLAPWKDDKTGITVDYSKMSYIEQAHIFGAEGTQQSNIYTELLEIVRAGGIPSYIEILIKELDE
jgi:hypothetical protein